MSSANGIPFLRLTKPQPPALSRVLRQRLERKIRLFDTKTREDDVKWTDAIRQSERLNQEAYQKDMRKDREITKKMQNIVDLETKMALDEGQTI
ncbi:hypothetical protein PSV08DRAFT_300228, partial [Bipolaris maydis]|uniref:uncharacterized protein n=1 Tax=Cochliobolus heterostrophus TaxID=5016 RepID=UPI0024DB74F1